eukprot:CAMPEP_0204114986 /NCGR_PEP_ID=MMETSP0361-20130328/4574_1 /ASSEMBLY_ACC=CAM_ASM_000343 /TAXON_ID=268821 /ORGANISM="Scrippsiella Hangoei, Strain SHTV-5" /LENGTH=102 /DNA_ID=CAMNT_0051065595 /DNA_START=163 /DNA_END=471 /DNA_ORIENTATION=+
MAAAPQDPPPNGTQPRGLVVNDPVCQCSSARARELQNIGKFQVGRPSLSALPSGPRARAPNTRNDGEAHCCARMCGVRVSELKRTAESQTLGLGPDERHARI